MIQKVRKSGAASRFKCPSTARTALSPIPCMASDFECSDAGLCFHLVELSRPLICPAAVYFGAVQVL
jgi:hypothetical protein